MENCTIYSHELDFDKVVQIVQSNLPKAKVELTDDGKQKSLTASIKGGLFSKGKSLTMHYRERENPSYKLDQIECGLTQNLAGMVNFIQSLPAQNIEVRDKFLHMVMSANCEMSFMVEPSITGEFESALKNIVQDLDAFIFAAPNNLFNKAPSQHFLDKNFNLILDAAGNCEIQDISVNVNAKYHDQPAEEYTAAQLDRKGKSERYLAEHNIKVNKNLPCAADAEQAQLRSQQEITDRAYALMMIAVMGEGIPKANLHNAIEGKSVKSFSPREQELLALDSLDDQQKAYATWRYKSLNVLSWALGKQDALDLASEICDVKALVGSMMTPSREEYESAIQLRTKEEILDELDKTYRINWACVDARIKGEQLEGGINPSVIYERHYALNWLTTYMDQAWDNVQTNT